MFNGTSTPTLHDSLGSKIERFNGWEEFFEQTNDLLASIFETLTLSEGSWGSRVDSSGTSYTSCKGSSQPSKQGFPQECVGTSQTKFEGCLG
jgi:hypothetical protein